MKKILFTTLALLIGFSAALAQSCYFNGITLSSQEQVDNFPNLVPGCTVVEGNLTINGTSTDNITDLSPLSMIDSVKGAVIILNSDMLTNLDGLNNLKYIGIVLSINGCDNLTNLSGLSKLKYTGGLSIINNTQFTDFTGMDSLQSVLDIVALGNPAMTNLAGLENLTAMRKLRLENNPALNSLEGIQNVSNLEQLILKNNPALAHLQGLEQLVEVKGLEIRSNHALADISALSGLTSLGTTFITDNNSLLSLTGLDNVSAISSFGSNASIQIARNPRLKDLSGLDNLQFVHFNLSIDELDSLTNLNALANLQGLGGTLRISYCNSLENLHGLEQLDSAFQLIIRSNPLLTNIDGLMGLSYVDNVGNTIIENNPQLGVCNIEVLCNKLLINPNAIVLTGNAAGCNTLLELEQSCGADDVQALVMIDTNGNCEADENDAPAAGIRVHLESANRISLRDTEADGIAYFGNLDSSYLSFDLPQFPTADWVACQDTLWLNTNIPDTLIGPRRVAFLLQALGDCPKPTVELGLPPYFSDCSANADIQAVISNRGGSAAENVQVSVIIPDDVLEVISAVPQATSHLGDTMRFDIGNLGVFESSKINLTVKTRCNMLLPDQTICLAAKVTQENLCEENPGPHSEIAIEP